jgi:hypothetical protein
VLRGKKVRLAYRPIDDVGALLAQLVGFGYGSHGGRRLNAIAAFSKFQGNGQFSYRTHIFCL